jgi:hypothetical protein
MISKKTADKHIKWDQEEMGEKLSVDHKDQIRKMLSVNDLREALKDLDGDIPIKLVFYDGVSEEGYLQGIPAYVTTAGSCYGGTPDTDIEYFELTASDLDVWDKYKKELLE